MGIKPSPSVYQLDATTILGVPNGNFETLRDGQKIIFLCEFETSSILYCKTEL